MSFTESTLQGTNSDRASSLQFGPDGRLYVAQYDGLIMAYTIERDAPNSYAVTDTETITEIQSIPNYNDDGSPSSETGRIVLGIFVAGTEENPVIYATSHYPYEPFETKFKYIGDTGVDTNSGVLSRLTWNGEAWEKLDLVRGLPRSEHMHKTNGLQLDSSTNTLYVAQGSNTNAGAPDAEFGYLPEYALSAAILKIDLDSIGDTTYDLPTLDDDTRVGMSDANDPFGGNDGKNQARLVDGGPVQVYAPGFRNPYDLVITESGRMYTIDNGGNAGSRDLPVDEGPDGTCLSEANEMMGSTVDSLHLLTEGYYGGHPNPTRANKENTFNADQQSPVTTANPVECDYREPVTEKGALTTFQGSTDGLAEYTASNFGGAMKGDLIAASFENRIYRIELNEAGDGAMSNKVLFSNVHPRPFPLDVTTQGDEDEFPGTIWAAYFPSGDITVYEPNESGSCDATDDPGSDADGDSIKNAYEIDLGTDPCSAADKPPDYERDEHPDSVDSDDDNDKLPDTSDPFAVDSANGAYTELPVWSNFDRAAQSPGGLLDVGFMGLMTDGTTDYQDLFDPDKMTVGGAYGALTIDEVSDGTAHGADNTQEYAFQLGINATADTEEFTVHTRILKPFDGLTPEDGQSMGMFLGTGDQDNYVELAISANGGDGGIQLAKEVDGAYEGRALDSVNLPGPDAIDLFLTVDPAANSVQASYVVTTDGVAGSRTKLGDPELIPAAWFGGETRVAVGIISTSNGSGPEFPATWDLFEVTHPRGQVRSSAPEE